MTPPTPTTLALLGALPLALLGGAVAAAREDAGAQDGAAFFDAEVRPILTEQCLKCHGGRERIKGGLRLTSRELLLAGGDSGPAVDLDAPDGSLLLKMVRYVDEDHQMPPPGKLPDESIAVLERWVGMQAPWGELELLEREAEPPAEAGPSDGLAGWSYRPLTRPVPPAVVDADWVREPIDAFVLARLEAAGLGPAPPADKVAWLRRASYDLIGLPPTPEEVDAFLADERPEAFDDVVERLLASPHYGEKWGRHWLDLVRYAETNGFERDSDKPYMWRYRDYVIESFNQDKPYDRFVLEQLAGDELDEVTPESLIATGYYRLMQWDDEPGQGVLQARYDTLDDIVSTTSQAFLGMTMGCARCHDHKKDPIPQKDYYGFLAYFHGLTDMSVKGHLTDVSSAEERAEHERARAAKEALEKGLAGELDGIEQGFLESLARVDLEAARADAPALTGLRYRFYDAPGDVLPSFDGLAAELEGTLPDGPLDLAPATRAGAFGFVFEGELAVPAKGEYAFRLAADDGARLSIRGQTLLEISGEGTQEATCFLKRGKVPIRVDYFQKDGPARLDLRWTCLPLKPWRYTLQEPRGDWTSPDYDDSGWRLGPAGFGAGGAPAARVGTEWSTRQIWLRREFDWQGEAREFALVGHHDEDLAVFVNGTPAHESKGYLRDYQELPVAEPALGALRYGRNVLAVACENAEGGQYVHVQPIERKRLGTQAPVDLAFDWCRLSSSPDSLEGPALVELVEARGAEVLGAEAFAGWRELREELEASRRNPVRRELAPAVQERGPEAPETFVLVRGNAATPGEAVEPHLPEALGGGQLEVRHRDGSSGRRRALAEWLVGEDHPLTARVMANRVWQHHFGRGLVRSSNDFGELGERPTHPELLDWLAVELRESGWSLKHLHRRIMASSSYRMSSAAAPEAQAADPRNDLFWRFDMRRLTAEELRDSMLAVTGLLNRQMGGPSFYSRMPVEALATSSRPEEAWGVSPDDQTRRRSVYIKVKRSLPTPVLAVFDQADTDQSCPVRFATTLPTQALTMLNSELVQHFASALAERLRAEAGDERADQVRHALRLLLGRRPTDAEVDENLRFMADLESEFSAEGADPLTDFCLTALSFSEFSYLD